MSICRAPITIRTWAPNSKQLTVTTKYQKLDGGNEISVMFWKFVCSSCTGCRQVHDAQSLSPMPTVTAHFRVLPWLWAHPVFRVIPGAIYFLRHLQREYDSAGILFLAAGHPYVWNKMAAISTPHSYKIVQQQYLLAKSRTLEREMPIKAGS